VFFRIIMRGGVLGWAGFRVFSASFLFYLGRTARSGHVCFLFVAKEQDMNLVWDSIYI
jgi:hypothetical protein